MRRFRVLGLVLLALGIGMASGCVQRRMVIRSNPPGATVYVDDYEIGRTPIAVNYTYYGTRRIRLAKDGYETLTVLQPIPPPWYEIPPLDLVSENFVPGELRDSREFCFQLRPQIMVPPEQLLQRAEQLRRSQSSGLPTSGIAPGMQPALPATGPVTAPGPLPATVAPQPAPLQLGPEQALPGQVPQQLPGRVPQQLPGQVPQQLPQINTPPGTPPGGWQVNPPIGN